MEKSRWLVLAISMAVPVMVARSQAEPLKPQSENKSTDGKSDAVPKGAVGEANAKRADDPNYVIEPEDELIVTVWKEPDISRMVPVRPDGKISLPLLNDVPAAGLTPMQLTAEITSRLKKYISAPEVTVIVSKVSPPRIFVLGEVGRAGAYPLMPAMTVLEAISSAGGLTAFAKQSKIAILRMENGKQIRLPVNYKDLVSGRRPDENFALKPGDTIVVP
jgi:polysaccharide biosynthesis/export protein